MDDTFIFCGTCVNGHTKIVEMPLPSAPAAEENGDPASITLTCAECGSPATLRYHRIVI